MGHITDDPTFGALAAAQARIDLLEQDGSHYRSTIADICTERDDYRAKLNRSELRNDSLRAQLNTFQAPPIEDPDHCRVEVHWNVVEATVVVDGFYRHVTGSLWDVAIESIWLRGADITALVTDGDIELLKDAVMEKLDQIRTCNMLEAA